MTKEELAQKLNGREYGSEITSDEEREAKAARLVVVFGYSDDNMEFRGAIHDEVGCYGKGVAYLNGNGLLGEHDEMCECPFCGYDAAKANCDKITAIWESGDYSWVYETEIPHAEFDVIDDGVKYCRGIVFSMNAVK
jgi:hypothetical protein